MDTHEPKTKEKIKIRIKKRKPIKLKAKPLILSCLVLLIAVFAGYFTYEVLTSEPTAEWQEVSVNAGPYVQLPKDDAPHKTSM